MRYYNEIQKMFEDMERNLFEMENNSVGKILPYPSHGKNVIESEYRKPLADIWETENEIRASFELPGVNKEDVEINVLDGNLEIKVEKKKEHKEEDKTKGIFRFERSYSGFYRCMKLPNNINANNIHAEYNNGILELKIPKLEIKNDVKRIQIK